MPDHRGRRVDEPRISDGTRQELIRRPSQAESPALYEGLVHCKWPRHADRLDGALDREARIIDGVMAGLAENLLRTLLAVRCRHAPLVFAHRRILGMNREVDTG